MRLLFVCAGNVCRSPLAEGLVTAWAARQAGLSRPPEVHVGSAGIEAAAGRKMDAHSARELARLGGWRPERPARALTGDLAAQADLVLTMTRRHRRAVLEMSPRGLQRTFTLLEAAALLSHTDLTGLTELPVGVRARELGRRLHERRRFHRSGLWDDIEDPIGRSLDVHARVADAIAEGLRPLLTVLGSHLSHDVRRAHVPDHESSGTGWPGRSSSETAAGQA